MIGEVLEAACPSSLGERSIEKRSPPLMLRPDASSAASAWLCRLSMPCRSGLGQPREALSRSYAGRTLSWRAVIAFNSNLLSTGRHRRSLWGDRQRAAARESRGSIERVSLRGLQNAFVVWGCAMVTPHAGERREARRELLSFPGF